MLYLDNRPITLLQGSGASDAVSTISTIEVPAEKPGSTSRALICDPVGKVIDAPYVVNDDAGMILLHSTEQKPKYLTALARTLSKSGGLVLDATEAINRMVTNERDDASKFSVSIGGLGVDSSWAIALAESNITPNDGIFEIYNQEVAMRIGGLTEHHLNGNFLPHHIALLDYVTLQNGCYPGQEVHAKIDAKTSITKRMVRLICETSTDARTIRTDTGSFRLIHPCINGYTHAICDDDVEDGDHFYNNTKVTAKTIYTAL